MDYKISEKDVNMMFSFIGAFVSYETGVKLMPELQKLLGQVLKPIEDKPVDPPVDPPGPIVPLDGEGEKKD